ncbi:MAG: NAD-dependent epimerase/dehydratase family protein, partial [Deltaproteobacteria bacterium]|nr:NAD-dependent epimerase/dehydratase family protein [Deltaproteobacteria bacterium]
MKKIYIAGHTGLVGSALVRYFSKQNVDLIVAPRSELDLTCQADVQTFISHKKPDAVIVACGRVGGIQANSKQPAEFIYENLMMEANLIHASWKAGVKKLLNFGSACIYPKECPQPMMIDHLMTNKLEPTNEPYALAKLSGMSLVSSYNRQYGTHYINAIPSNLYGPGDCFDLERCHVIAALIRRFHEAKEKKMNEVILWGSGQVERDFLFIDDFAEACDLLLQRYDQAEPINVGAERPCTIR